MSASALETSQVLLWEVRHCLLPFYKTHRDPWRHHLNHQPATITLARRYRILLHTITLFKIRIRPLLARMPNRYALLISRHGTPRPACHTHGQKYVRDMVVSHLCCAQAPYQQQPMPYPHQMYQQPMHMQPVYQQPVVYPQPVFAMPVMMPVQHVPPPPPAPVDNTGFLGYQLRAMGATKREVDSIPCVLQ